MGSIDQILEDGHNFYDIYYKKMWNTYILRNRNIIVSKWGVRLGMSFLSRKYCLATDNVLDALLINASAKVMDKNTMGNDIFLALRSGDDGSWGAVYA